MIKSAFMNGLVAYKRGVRAPPPFAFLGSSIWGYNSKLPSCSQRAALTGQVTYWNLDLRVPRIQNSEKQVSIVYKVPSMACCYKLKHRGNQNVTVVNTHKIAVVLTDCIMLKYEKLL
jgi:hypothetical protein